MLGNVSMSRDILSASVFYISDQLISLGPLHHLFFVGSKVQILDFSAYCKVSTPVLLIPIPQTKP